MNKYIFFKLIIKNKFIKLMLIYIKITLYKTLLNKMFLTLH